MITTVSSLDGNGTNRGQGQEGKTLTYEEFIFEQYGIYAPYLTIEEMQTLYELEHTFRPTLIQREQASELWDKVNLEKINDGLTTKLVLLKHAKRKSHAAYDLGAREFTFTYSPKWLSDSEARIEMSNAMTKLLKYYAEEIVQLRAVGEVGSNGLSHIHCFYKLQGGLKITDKNFKRAWKYWNPKKLQGRGFEGGHHQTVKIESDFMGYIEKDIENAWLEIARPLPQ